MTNKDPSKYPYDRSEYVVMPPIRKSEDGALTTEPPPINVEELKREVYSQDFVKYCETNKDLCDCIVDHLASAGYFRAPLPRIEGLEEALACLDDDSPQYTYNLIVQFKEKYKCMPNVKFQEAARAYLALQGGE